MALDIKEKIEDLVEKIQKNPAMLKKFNTEPVKVVEELVGIDLPDELIEKVVDGVKAKSTGIFCFGRWNTVFSHEREK